MNTFQKNPIQLFLVFAILLVLQSSCNKDDDTNSTPVDLVSNETAAVPLAWMSLYLDIDRYMTSFHPGPTSRALAYINLAAYESVMKGMPEYKSVKSLFNGLSLPDAGNQEYHFPTVVNTVYANLFKRMLPGEYIEASQQSRLQFDILALESEFNETFNNLIGSDVFTRSKEHGDAIANAVWQWAKSDAFGHEAHLNPSPQGYTPPNGPGLWKPTPPDFSSSLFPYWGNTRTFAISQTQKLSAEPLTFDENPGSQFYVQALEVRNTVNNLEFNDQWQAEFWRDDQSSETFSPVARWISIACQVIEKDDCHLETALYTLVKLSLALNDAGVACWFSKYTYSVERPISYINRVIDANWSTYQPTTPSFPSYPSSHATFSAAAAEVLSHVFGYVYSITDNSHEGREEFLGMPRSYVTFYQMAEENAASRIKSGVNFRMDIEEGMDLGFEIGRKVNTMPFK